MLSGLTQILSPQLNALGERAKLAGMTKVCNLRVILRAEITTRRYVSRGKFSTRLPVKAFAVTESCRPTDDLGSCDYGRTGRGWRRIYISAIFLIGIASGPPLLGSKPETPSIDTSISALGNQGGPVAGLACKMIVLRHRFWSVVTGADIPLNCNIGGGLVINHPNGIVIHPAAQIGVNCLISQQVTVGTRGRPGLPRIGGHVDIGAGAKILGPVRVGDHAKIGANAVVVNDVPNGAVAIGVPAKVEGAEMHQAEKAFYPEVR